MKCVKCGGRCLVVDSKRDGKSVQRCRKCESCGHIMYTEEVEAIDNGDYFRTLKSKYGTEYYQEHKMLTRRGNKR